MVLLWKEKLSQWFLISLNFQDLLDGLETLDSWPNKVKTMQKNWIGKSFGSKINFKIEGDLSVSSIKCLQKTHTLWFCFFSFISSHEISNYII